MARTMELGLFLLVAATVYVVVAVAPYDQLDNSRPSDPAAHQDDVSHLMTLEAEQVMFDMKKQLGFKRITGIPEPLYRKDLSRDYVAYWQVELDASDVMIVSAGPQTGDNKFILQGRLPGPTAYLSNTARDNGAVCFRYYMLSPMGEMMCEDEEGNVVATNIDIQLLSNVTNVNPYDTVVNQFIQERLCDIRALWAKHSVEVAQSGQWHDEIVTNEDDLDDVMADEDDEDVPDSSIDSDSNDSDGDDEQSFQESTMVPGDLIRVALGNPAMLSRVNIRPVNQDSNSTEPDLELQRRLCSVISVCAENQINGLVGQEYILEDPDTGLGVLEFHILENFKDVFGTDDLDFVVEIHRQNGQVVLRNYAVEHQPSRQKRSTQYTSWSSWTVRSIPNEDWFPDYTQHTIPGRRCAVGCGPVAWAMIMGYFDRRSHMSSSTYGTGSQGIYRSGSDGTTGSNSQVAPSSSDSRMQKYTEKINDILGTWCIGSSGATLMYRMPRIEGFFKARQTSGGPKVTKKSRWYSLTGIYSDSIATWSRDRLNDGWPVIVGTKEGWFTGWHYPVATQYRSRSRRSRRCWRIFGKNICLGWKTETDHDMYLHMGWGGSKNGWYDMKSFYSVAAVY